LFLHPFKGADFHYSKQWLESGKIGKNHNSPTGQKWLSGELLANWLVWKVHETSLKATGQPADFPLPLAAYRTVQVFHDGKCRDLAEFYCGEGYTWSSKTLERSMCERHIEINDWLNRFPKGELARGEYAWLDPLKQSLSNMCEEGDELGTIVYAMKPSPRIGHFTSVFPSNSINRNPTPEERSAAYLMDYEQLMGEGTSQRYLTWLKGLAKSDSQEDTVARAVGFGYVLGLMRIHGIHALGQIANSDNLALWGTFPDQDAITLSAFSPEFEARKNPKIVRRGELDIDCPLQGIMSSLSSLERVKDAVGNSEVLPSLQRAERIRSYLMRGSEEAYALID